MESYIEDKKNLYRSIKEFLEGTDETNDEEIKEVIRNNTIEGDSNEMRQFLEIIKNIGEHHHGDQNFNKRINQLLIHYKDQIKQTVSNSELFHIFENNKKISLFLIQEGIITISEEISNYILNKYENNGNRYCYFFVPELEQFFGEEKMKVLKDELLKENPNIFTNYEEKREEGENDSYICLLIRQDSIEEFVSHVTRYNFSPMSIISRSIFETNAFLIDNKNTTLIEYSAFFGSIQIFRYLLMNKAELTPSLWLYTIHSKNAELIHLLESNEVPPPKLSINGQKYKDKNSSQNYEQCLIESIKCHHNDFANYFENNFIDQNGKYLEENEEIISIYIKYHNYAYFQNESTIDNGFFYLSFYHYDKLPELLLKKKEKMIENKKIQYRDIRDASENNDIKVIYYFLLQMQEISKGIFENTKIAQIAIPPSITSIGDSAFNGCSSLTQIAIPSSVTSIGELSFYRCSSLKHITIPFSVNSIGKHAFSKCTSLTKITIPFSVTSIGNSAFLECKSLTKITIPSSVISIGEYTFFECSSLTQIIIPSSVTSIGNSAFSKCKSLTQITIPSSVISIGKYTFSECKSLTQITIPSSVTSIGDSAFNGCSSLTQITIPSSVTSIGDGALKNCHKINKVEIVTCEEKRIEYYNNKFLAFKTKVNSEIYDEMIWVKPTINEIIIPTFIKKIGNHAFSGCSSLAQITIPSSIKSIGNCAFYGCSSLTQITFEINSSVASIGDSAFSGCSSLTQITIPFFVTSIRNDVFKGCTSLTQISIPYHVTSIGDGAFFGCSSLTQITIPSYTTSIGDSSFFGCSSLKQITIPFQVRIVGIYAFGRCSSLTQVTILSPVVFFKGGTFIYCLSITETRIPSSVDENKIGFCSNTRITYIY